MIEEMLKKCRTSWAKLSYYYEKDANYALMLEQSNMFDLHESELLRRFATLEAENKKVKDLNDRWNKATSIMTCGGSEFINDPEYTAEYVSRNIRGQHVTIVELKKQIAALSAENKRLKERISHPFLFR